jgi:23S rRNA (uracil1939-C5)-methyltransferase
VRQKAAILREQLRRVGRIEYDGEIDVAAGQPLAYRNRSQFHVDRGRIGYFGEGSHELVAIDHCPISSPRLNEALGELVKMAGDRRWPGFVRSVELFTNETDVMVNVLDASQPVAKRFFEWCAERIPGADRGFLEYSATGRVFQVSHNSFFQVNRFLVDRLVETAIEEWAGEAALDLYAGVGLFALALAGRFERVTAVESGASAVRDLRVNAERASVSAVVTAVQANVEAFLTRFGEAAPELVLADPPRAGLGKTVAAELVRLRPARIVIVSCDPSTLARDLAGLLAGGYRMERVTMVDLFPQTYHLESVVSLRLE